MKTLTNTSRGYWCAALGGIIWGLSGVAGQFLLSVYDASPFWLTGVRMTCAGIVFLILSLRQTRSLGIVVRHPKELITVFIYGIFGLMLNQLSYFFSISYSNAGTATVLQTLCVVMMAVLVCLQRSRLPYGLSLIHILRAHETRHDLVCRLLLEKKKNTSTPTPSPSYQTLPHPIIC